jgi:hypothetical protein
VRVMTYQDTPRVRPCRLFLDFLSRKVLVSHYPHQRLTPNIICPSQPGDECFPHDEKILKESDSPSRDVGTSPLRPSKTGMFLKSP